MRLLVFTLERYLTKLSSVKRYLMGPSSSLRMASCGMGVRIAGCKAPSKTLEREYVAFPRWSFLNFSHVSGGVSDM